MTEPRQNKDMIIRWVNDVTSRCYRWIAREGEWSECDIVFHTQSNFIVIDTPLKPYWDAYLDGKLEMEDEDEWITVPVNDRLPSIFVNYDVDLTEFRIKQEFNHWHLFDPKFNCIVKCDDGDWHACIKNGDIIHYHSLNCLNKELFPSCDGPCEIMRPVY